MILIAMSRPGAACSSDLSPSLSCGSQAVARKPYALFPDDQLRPDWPFMDRRIGDQVGLRLLGINDSFPICHPVFNFASVRGRFLGPWGARCGADDCIQRDHSSPRKYIDYSALDTCRETVPRNLSGRLCATLSRTGWFDHL